MLAQEEELLVTSPELSSLDSPPLEGALPPSLDAPPPSLDATPHQIDALPPSPFSRQLAGSSAFSFADGYLQKKLTVRTSPLQLLRQREWAQ